MAKIRSAKTGSSNRNTAPEWVLATEVLLSDHRLTNGDDAAIPVGERMLLLQTAVVQIHGQGNLLAAPASIDR